MKFLYIWIIGSREDLYVYVPIEAYEKWNAP